MLNYLLYATAFGLCLFPAAGVVTVLLTLPWSILRWTAVVLVGWVPTSLFGVLFYQELARGKWLTLYPTMTSCVIACAMGVAIGFFITPFIGLRRQSTELNAKKVSRWPMLQLVKLECIVLVVAAITIVLLDLQVKRGIAGLRVERDRLEASLGLRMVAPEKNAATIYDQVTQRLEHATLPDWFKKSADPDFVLNDEAIAFLETHQKTFESIDRASRMELCRFSGINSNRLLPIGADEPTPLKHVSTLVALAARKRAADGDLAGAMEVLAILKRIAHQLEQDPRSHMFLVRISHEWMWSSQLEQILATKNWSPDQLPPLSVVQRKSVLPDLMRIIDCEAARTYEFFANLCLGELNDVPILRPEVRQSLRDSRGILLVMRVFYWGDCVRTLPAGFDEFRQILDRSTLEVEKSSDELHSRQCFLTRNFMQATTHLTYPASLTDTERDMTAVGLALATHYANQHQYPSDLHELTPKYLERLPNDPFTEQPLGYLQLREGGAMLFSRVSRRWQEFPFNRGIFCVGAAYDAVRVRQDESQLMEFREAVRLPREP